MTKDEFKKLSNERLIDLYKENNYSLSKIDKKFNFSNDYSRRLFLSRGIDYNKIRTEFEETIEINYLNNPTTCKHCGKVLPLENRNNKFCCKSCAASENNLGIIRNKTGFNGNKKKTEITKNNKDKKVKAIENSKNSDNKNSQLHKNKCCINCGKELNHSGTFCNQSCQGEYRHKQAYEDFLNNNEKYCSGGYNPKPFKDDFLSEQGGVCSICGCRPEWNDKPLTFILDHIDGDASNNKRENLRVICPNCDSQLPTYKSKNKNSKRRKYWKEKIIRDILNNNNSIETNNK